MPDSSQAVFIDQMPDYQEALQKIASLPKSSPAFLNAVENLNLTKQWQETKEKTDQLRGKAEDIITREGNAVEQYSYIKNKVSTRTSLAAAGAGVVAGIVGYKQWGALKGAVAATITALAVKLIGGKISAPKDISENKELQSINAEKKQLTLQSLELQKPFMEMMATEMLAQQKAFEGVGENMKLVSTKEPAPETSMAAKYAPAPAASNAAMVAAQREAATAAASR